MNQNIPAKELLFKYYYNYVYILNNITKISEPLLPFATTGAIMIACSGTEWHNDN